MQSLVECLCKEALVVSLIGPLDGLSQLKLSPTQSVLPTRSPASLKSAFSTVRFRLSAHHPGSFAGSLATWSRLANFIQFQHSHCAEQARDVVFVKRRLTQRRRQIEKRFYQLAIFVHQHYRQCRSIKFATNSGEWKRAKPNTFMSRSKQSGGKKKE
jgi:hypothetical protein